MMCACQQQQNVYASILFKSHFIDFDSPTQGFQPDKTTSFCFAEPPSWEQSCGCSVRTRKMRAFQKVGTEKYSGLPFWSMSHSSPDFENHRAEVKQSTVAKFTCSIDWHVFLWEWNIFAMLVVEVTFQRRPLWPLKSLWNSSIHMNPLSMHSLTKCSFMTSDACEHKNRPGSFELGTLRCGFSQDGSFPSWLPIHFSGNQNSVLSKPVQADRSWSFSQLFPIVKYWTMKIEKSRPQTSALQVEMFMMRKKAFQGNQFCRMKNWRFSQKAGRFAKQFVLFEKRHTSGRIHR